ncbi:putative inactive leucine-rich repeat receptor-like protein kinase IMK2 [Senna tora]|uniref:Putative inactive leucine-rich repeat receptor-like protein kinase IMK2 n=1 Tax=Senna tora TaxID=362788 RepID=A0A834TPT2_9FABA|nr:putative inactive leucine-rich repeat receptor-like protein kinase IMK2 [Senna tora]
MGKNNVQGCFFFILVLQALSLTLQPVSGGHLWDGVIVTQADFQALRAIKHEMIDSNGVLRSWNDSGIGACSGGWAGIKCVNGQVIAIQLPWKGLGGRISEKIGQLQALRKLSLHDNVLSGPVPWSLGFLPNLRGLYLFNNRLSGSIPPSIGNNSPVLQSIDISNNALTGIIPPSLANSTRLYRLNLSFNSLSGSIPKSFTLSSSLTILALQHNNLSGSIPDSWGGGGMGKNKTFQLQILTLDHNLISGTIPVSLSKMGLLQEISLSNNKIVGSIPSELDGLSRLQILDLSNNAINGSFPDTFDKFQNLTVLNLKSNKLEGEIPSTIGNISGINSIDFSENKFVGEIPDSFTKLANLSSFNVSYNNLSGLVPSLLSKKFNSSSFAGNLQLCGKRAASKGKNGKTTKAATATTGAARNVEKGDEVESGGEAGGKLVHFDGPFVFTADDLLCATAEIMGKSAYGTAYKATLEDGNQVAVKRLREKTTKGQKEFETEVAALGKIRHPNLLALRAYYLGPKGEKLLVFDYMPKGSLASFLHARGPEIVIDWPTRMRIALGVTRGLCYLHTQENIVHGNLTSSNILLDEQTNAHITDFGLSRLMTTSANTNIIATAGSLGYNAPELTKTKKPSTKTDAYSLGVIILELLTGKPPGEPTNGLDLPQWVASIVKEEWTNEVFDLELMRDAPAIGDELLNTLKLALHCVDPSPSARPEVQQILQQLEEIKPDLADDGAKAAAPTSE